MELFEISATLRWHGERQRISLGDPVRLRNGGRLGYATQVTRDRIYVRFHDAPEKSIYLFRSDVDSVDYLLAQGECIEDDAAAAAYARLLQAATR